MKTAYALGMKTYKPFKVEYSFTPKEFAELAMEFCKQQFEINVIIEAKVEEMQDSKSEHDKYNIGLHVIDPNEVNEDDYYVLVAFGLHPEEPFSFAERMMNQLFLCGPEYYIHSTIEDIETPFFITTVLEYKYFLKYKGNEAEKDSEY